MELVVDYMLTARCNLHCPFCYGPPPEMSGELRTEHKHLLIQSLASRNTSHIVFGGGEPLLCKDAPVLVKAAYERGLRVGLQTNGFYFDRLRQVLPFVDWLGLPIDGISATVQQLMRTSSHQLENTRRAVQLVHDEANHDTHIKIGTVVSALNIRELVEIADNVAALRPDVWKLYEVRFRGAAATNREHLGLDRNALSDSVSQIRAKYPELSIFVSYREQSRNAYVIVNPDSEVLIPRIDDYVRTGHLINQTGSQRFDEQVWARTLEQLDVTAQQQNIRGSFPGWIEERT